MKTCTLFFILGMLCLNVKDLSGQEPITLEENDSWLAGTRYFQIGDGLYTPIGRNGDKLRRHLLSNADALREMDQYRSKRNTARGLVITTSVSGSILIFSGLMQSVFSYGGLGFFSPRSATKRPSAAATRWPFRGRSDRRRDPPFRRPEEGRRPALARRRDLLQQRPSQARRRIYRSVVATRRTPPGFQRPGSDGRTFPGMAARWAVRGDALVLEKCHTSRSGKLLKSSDGDK